MNKDEAILKIKELLSFSSKEVKDEVVSEVKFLDVTDNDGNVLRTNSEELIIGDEIKVVTEAGEELIPDSEYTLDDGRVIKTDADSKISEIIEADATATDDTTTDATTTDATTTDATTTDATEMSEVVAEETTDVKTEDVKTEDVKTDVETVTEEVSVETRISNLEGLVKELISKQSNIAEATMSVVKVVEKIGEMPVIDDVEDLKSTFSSIKENSKSVREKNLEAIRNMRTKK